MIKNNLPYFIDYQSGRRGALQYDVASLLFDANADLSQALRDELLEKYLTAVRAFAQVDAKKFMKYYYGFVLIRMMQAFGAYGFLSVVKKKKHFFKSVPFAINNLKILLDKNLEIFNLIPALRTVFNAMVSDETILEFGTNEEKFDN